MILNARVGYPGVRSGTIIASLFLVIAGCSSTIQLSEAERQKLDPQLTMLLRGDAVSDSDLDVGLRKDGSKEYAVIIRSTNVEEMKQAGIQVGSAFSDVITARVTIPELKKILGMASVRAVQASSKNRPQ
jgi:hypothetical protein